MSVWVTIPSARPAEEVAAWALQWQALGYKVAVVRDVIDLPPLPVDYVIYSGSLWGGYPGYAVAVNTLIRHILISDGNAQWFVIGGDDVLPEPSKPAAAIAAECQDFFLMNVLASQRLFNMCGSPAEAATCGVMQPTGDRWGAHERHNGKTGSAYIDRVCGSAWIGATFAQRVYEGFGPLFEGYHHMYVDEELHAIATAYGVLWQRPDLTHLHKHWARPRSMREDMPEFLGKWNTDTHWRESRGLFESRSAAGFPGHEWKMPAPQSEPAKARTGSAINARAIGDEEIAG